MRSVRAILVAAVCALAAYEFATGNHAQTLLGDFRAFYCAGSALDRGADPYAASSLTACENGAVAFGLYRAPHGIAVPAPFPAYALLAFAPFALLPYSAACVLWILMLALAGIACAIFLARLANARISDMLVVLAPALAVVALPYGQLSPIELCALSAMAFAMRRGRRNAATAAAACAAIVPNVGALAIAGAFAAEKRMRPRLAALAAALTGIDVAVRGFGSAERYFTAVLPAQAASDVARTSQYGFAWMLSAAGIPVHAALIGGDLSYVFMAFVGLCCAIIIARKRSDAAYAVLIPPAFAVFGGAYVHYGELVAALPAAVVLYASESGRRKTVFFAAIVLVAIPWAWILTQPQLLVVFALFAMAIAVRLHAASPRIAAVLAAGCALTGALILEAARHFGTGLAVIPAMHIDPHLAQAAWSDYVRARWTGTGAVWWIAKAPTWAGLALLTFGCANAVAKKDLEFRVAVEHAPAAS